MAKKANATVDPKTLRRSTREKRKRAFTYSYVDTEGDAFEQAMAEHEQKPIPEKQKTNRRKKKSIVPEAMPEDRKKKKDNRSEPLLLTDMHVGDIVSQTHYFRITDVQPGTHQFNYLTLRGPNENDTWRVNTSDRFAGISGSYVKETIPCTKTELAQRLMACKDEVFTVTFKPVLSVERLAESIQSVPTELWVERNAKALAKRILNEETESKTLTGRLVTANTELGYSLIDSLGDTPMDETCPVRFRNVNHRDMIELIHRGVRYVLK